MIVLSNVFAHLARRQFYSTAEADITILDIMYHVLLEKLNFFQTFNVIVAGVCSAGLHFTRIAAELTTSLQYGLGDSILLSIIIMNVCKLLLVKKPGYIEDHDYKTLALRSEITLFVVTVVPVNIQILAYNLLLAELPSFHSAFMMGWTGPTMFESYLAWAAVLSLVSLAMALAANEWKEINLVKLVVIVVVFMIVIGSTFLVQWYGPAKVTRIPGYLILTPIMMTAMVCGMHFSKRKPNRVGHDANLH